MELRKKSETSNTIVLEWNPVSGAIGYRFQSAKSAPKWSHTWDASRTSVEFSKADWYKVEALGSQDEGKYPPEPTHPVLPALIDHGGTYKGQAVSSASGTPAVTNKTSEPVIIEDSIIEQKADGLLVGGNPAGQQITFRRVQFIGIPGGVSRLMNPENYKSVIFENCTITHTGGIYLQTPQAGATIIIRRNRCKNIQGKLPGSIRQFVQFNGVQGASILVEWNEVINEYQKSLVEDVISIFKTDHAVIKNNYIQGGYPSDKSLSHSGTGIMLGDVGGSYNLAEDNQVVGITNLGISIVGGHDNTIKNNRVVSDGKLPDGTALAGANNGIVCYNGYSDPSWNNNRVLGNVVGAYHSGNPMYRNDWWCPGAANNVDADNQHLPNPVTNDTELAEWTRWQQKLQTNNIKIGV